MAYEYKELQYSSIIAFHGLLGSPQINALPTSCSLLNIIEGELKP